MYAIIRVSINKNLVFDLFLNALDGYKIEKVAYIYYYSGKFLKKTMIIYEHA